ncbi:CPA_1a_G0000080.mRNA.1.CDS.1 [Saccharomyces cerevisiae]|nr:CPA_1a_G0000080.mRNA.1.CDS.1 [Saccharomyces cerevisiae]CAI4234731.1 BBM_1a_G0000040.mRNA.1.CDS.1 [Saccharomyces cerevisiae]CAI7032893.1 BBM_1a_G0000040.mRNA.1.CDS.1 [Saccharomyces cerevisiae]CAI7123067.1 CPA_1a_G0000080.mRNA.1.CDS.1 [Saccharomyces cerevisiae]
MFFDEGLLGFSRQFSLFTLLYEEDKNFLTSKNFIYENGTQVQLLSIIINEQEKFGSLGREMNGYFFRKIVWKTKSCSLMNAISKRSLCGTLVTL